MTLTSKREEEKNEMKSRVSDSLQNVPRPGTRRPENSDLQRFLFERPRLKGEKREGEDFPREPKKRERSAYQRRTQ